jgi:Flp pilus assembly protein TadD
VSTPVEDARGLIENGDHQLAIETLLPHLEQAGEDVHGWSALAAAHFNLEQWAEAREAAVKATELGPDNARYWSNLGTIDRKAGHLKSASQAQQRALEFDPLSEQANTERWQRTQDPRGPALISRGRLECLTPW